MTVHHLNCATMRPRLAPAMVAHVLLVERPAGLLLVDTGFGTDDLADPRRLGRPFTTMVRPRLAPDETAVAQVRRLGHDPADVTDIAVTHLDLDHAGGLGDFPNARVHVHRTEHEAATRPSLRERSRYLSGQWAHGPSWVLHHEAGDDWFGFSAVPVLDDDVLLVPLPGHTRGHSGVAVRRPDGHWLLHAGDAYFDGRQVAATPGCNRSLAAFQVAMAVDNRRRRDNLERLHELANDRDAGITLFCAHDKASFETLSAAPA